MKYRQEFKTTAELAAWYDRKYTEMGGTWHTPPEDCAKHLDALEVPFDRSKCLLDVGCGGGHFLLEASKRVRCMGAEVSAEARKYANELLRYSDCFISSVSIEIPAWYVNFDYVVSIGSLEHVVDLDAALDSIRNLLKPTGEFYFLNPNSKWIHEDQPNERTADAEWWIPKLAEHGLIVTHTWDWGDNTAYRGHK